jgi:uncharacterized protein
MKNAKKFSLLIILMIGFILALAAQTDIPERPSPPRLVNDFTGTLSRSEVNHLENTLVAFNDSTSTQIVVVFVNSLEGYDKAQFADLLGEKWGVGHKGKDNGLVVLVKPKSAAGKGEVFIATGYGLEGAVPDAVIKQITDDEMIPFFKQNQYFEGVQKGTEILMKLTAGEFTAEDYLNRTSSDGNPLAVLIPFIIIIVVFAKLLGGRRGMKHLGGNRGSSLPFWAALFLANQLGRGQGGKWSDFSSGTGSFGGWSGGSGGGGFGGFGGGSFGGGGAGGSW